MTCTIESGGGHGAGHHDHHHDHGGEGHNHDYREVGKRVLALALVVTLAGMALEIVGGIISNSLALISDAGHMFTHVVALAIALGAIVIASRARENPDRSFGLYRLEIIGAFVNALFLLVVTVLILVEAWGRFNDGGSVRAVEMLVVAVVGLVVNLISAYLLSRAGKAGSGNDLNIRGAFIHMLADTLSSVGVIVAAGVMQLTGWYWLDPAVSVVIALVIGLWAFRLIRDSVSVLLESVPRGMDARKIITAITGVVPEVIEVHDLHLWEITSGLYSMTAHVVVEDMPLHRTNEIRESLEDMLVDKFRISHITLQFECPCHVSCEIDT